MRPWDVRYKTNASLSHGNTTCLRTLYSAHFQVCLSYCGPPFFLCPHPVSISITFCGCYTTSGNISWRIQNGLCSSMIKVDILCLIQFLSFVNNLASVCVQAANTSHGTVNAFLCSQTQQLKQKGEMAGDMPIINRWKMSDKRGP